MQNKGTTMKIDAHELTVAARDKLTSRLESFGNRLSPPHRRALWEILKAYSEMASGERRGRWAFPLFTGGGKTQSIVCWLSAASEMGYLEDISVSVCASRVEALCELKRDLVNVAGIPEEKIGLRHSYTYDPERAGAPGYASEPATEGNEDRPILLITHNLVKAKGGIERFNLYQGQPRTLLIWDETLIKSSSSSLQEVSIRSAIGWAWPLLEGKRGKVEVRDKAMTYIENALKLLQEELEWYRQHPDEKPRLFSLPPLTAEQVAAYKRVFKLNDITSTLHNLIDISQQTLRVVDAGAQGEGLFHCEVVVDPELENIVVLDASFEIRKLCHYDTSLQTPKDYPDNIVSYEQVEVFQIPYPGGRKSIHKALCQPKTIPLIKEVIDIIATIPEEEAVLFFTFIPKYDFKHKRMVHTRKYLEKAMVAAGIDPYAKVADGRDRFCWLTHGNETSLSKYSYTTNQIWIGVLYRDLVDLYSQAAGQYEDMLVDLSKEDIRAVCESELAYCYHQGFSRSACRVVKDGMAGGTKIWITFFHQAYDPEKLIRKAMHGVKWQGYKPKYLEDRVQTRIMVRQIRDHLKQLEGAENAAGGLKISTQKLKVSTGLQEVAPSTWTRILTDAVSGLKLWAKDGRSVVYLGSPEAFGFQN